MGGAVPKGRFVDRVSSRVWIFYELITRAKEMEQQKRSGIFESVAPKDIK